MPTLKDYENIDESFNPSSQAARALIEHEQKTGEDAGVNAGIDQAEKFANDPANSSANIDDAREREEATNEFGYKNDTEAKSPRTFSFKGALRSKRAASGGIIGLLIAFLGGASMFLTPGIAAVQMKEILTDDLNDQLGAMDKRSAYVMRAKLNDLGKGVCTGVKIRCGFKGMSDRQVAKFRAAGFEVETDGKVLTRNHVKSLTITDSYGNKVKVDNPRELNRIMGDRVVQQSLRKAFNPKFAGFFDAKWDAFKQKYKLTSGDKLGTGTEEEQRKNITSAVEGDPISIDGAEKVATTDKDGKTIDGAADTNEDIDKTNSNVSSDGVSTKSLLGSAGKGALKGLGVIGAADMACTVKNTARAVEAGAKIYRYRQLVAYSMVFLTFADSVKAGTATPEQAELVGNTLTAVDTDEKVVGEDSETDESGNATLVDNPYYGANAFDSAGYKTALYNEAPTLSARDMQMAVGGGIALGMLSKVNGFLKKNGADNCKVIQNWAVRGGSLVIGLALGAITLGTYTAVSVGASVAISMALPILENYLAQMTAGTVVDGNTNGVDAGNAIFAGSAGIMGGMAMTRGMKPATKSDLEQYQAMNNEVKAEYVAMETEDAKATPLDVNNRYSFVGSLTRSLLPLKTTSSISIGNGIMNNLSHILTTATRTPVASATSTYNPERYDKCEDTGYNEIGIDADVFCNVRYVLTPYELGLDTEEVRAQMLEWGMVNDDDEGSVVSGSDYDNWLTECTTREQGWGETESENPDDGNGARCMKTEKQDSYYRVYTMDSSIIAAMDYIPPTTTSGLSGGSNLRVATFNVRGLSHTNGDGRDEPTTEASTWENRIKYTANTITSNNFEVVSFQEFEPAQRDYIRKNIPDIEISTHGKESDAIGWNTSRFQKVDQGTWQTTYFGGPIDEPWVKLQDIATQQEFYVMSVHDPINRDQGNAAVRTENARKHLALVNQFKTSAPVILMGDFNSGYTKEFGAGAKSNDTLAYCILTAGGTMNDAYDLSIPRPAKCPNEPTNGTKNYIDHIYLTPEMQVGSFKELERGYKNNGSDHPTIYVDVVIPASETASTGAGTSFIMGTYNQPSRGNTSAAVAKIKETQMDVIGMQETSRDNYQPLKEQLGRAGYKPHLDVSRNQQNSPFCTYGRSIFYKTEKFKMVKYEYFDVPSYAHKAEYTEPRECNGERTKGGGRNNVPVVWLQDVATGQTIIVMNTHNLASCCGAENAPQKRYQSSQIYVEKVRSLKAANPGIPIFFSGDFNEGTGVRRTRNVTYQFNQNNLLYCMFKKTGEMFMAFGGREQPCLKDNEGYGGVDYVYATKGVKVEWSKEFLDPSTNSSPHKVHYGKLTVPGAGGGSGKIVWPVPGVKQMGTLAYGASGSKGIHKGIDIGISGGGALGKEVVATHTGVVDRVWGQGDDCGAYVSIKATGAGYYAAYQHLDGGSIKVEAGDQVTAGQPIAKIGRQGGSTCGSSGFYHLHYSIESKGGSVSAYADPFPNGTKDPLKILPKP